MPIDKKELKELIGHESPNIIEIGAYDGKDTRELRDLFRWPTVMAFEADLDSAIDLEENLQYDCDKIWFYRFAIGDKDAPAPWYTGNHPSSNSTRPPKLHKEVWPEILFGGVECVPQYRLDTIIASFCCPFIVEPDNLDETDDIDLIWADVNGAELQVIEGAQETLKKTKLLYIEFGVKELYEGQGSLADIQQALPGYWVLLKTYDVGENFGNALFQNKELS